MKLEVVLTDGDVGKIEIDDCDAVVVHLEGSQVDRIGEEGIVENPTKFLARNRVATPRG
ncbi:hypothetical protein [Prescottella agglutinans]|uniref:hypothetical protein n=1 Tax=Prescottella agglutinans TaxID=1644129 RepID=UPI002475F9AD|nr:hypothetical protein [Prescottella agglutinans]